jgi:hypothetical protein
MKKLKISNEIERLLTVLTEVEPGDERYEIVAKNLKTLKEADGIRVDSISKEAILGAVISIGSLLLILNYERTGSITSKALGFLKRS